LPVCTARKDDLAGLAVTTDEQIGAYVLYVTRGIEEAEIVSLRSLIDDGGARLKQLLSQLHAKGMQTFRFPKVHPAEISKEWLETLGVSDAGGHLLYARRLFDNAQGRLEGSQSSYRPANVGHPPHLI
jgi:hypothetical protein